MGILCKTYRLKLKYRHSIIKTKPGIRDNTPGQAHRVNPATET